MSLNSIQVVVGNPAKASEYNKLRKDMVAMAGDFATTGGSSTAYTLTLDEQWTLTDGNIVVCRLHTANGAAPTLNVTPNGGSATGAIALKTVSGTAPPAGSIPTNSIIVARYNSSLSCYQLLIASSVQGTIDTLNAGETINGGTLPVPVYQLAADSEWYACDANVTTKLNYTAFAISNSTDGNAISLQVGGVVAGFSGLTVGSKYYVQDAVGTIGTTPGTYEILVGIAISTTQLLMIREDSVAMLDSNAVRTAESGTSGTTTGSFTVNTPRRAKLIEFDITLLADEQSGSNGTDIKTWHCWMDLINQRILALQIYSTSSGNETSPSIKTSGAANKADLVDAVGGQAMSGSVLSVTGTGSASVTSIVSTENAITFNYSLTAGGGDKAGIALSTVKVLG